MGHTPGPWDAHSSIYDHMIAEVRAVMPGEERGIAQVWSHPNGFADARLMAAPPDLFEASQRALENIQGIADGDDIPSTVIRDMLRAAISKATGAP